MISINHSCVLRRFIFCCLRRGPGPPKFFSKLRTTFSPRLKIWIRFRNKMYSNYNVRLIFFWSNLIWIETRIDNFPRMVNFHFKNNFLEFEIYFLQKSIMRMFRASTVLGNEFENASHKFRVPKKNRIFLETFKRIMLLQESPGC